MAEMAVTFDEQLEELDREIAMRERLYPKWVQDDRLKVDAARKQLARLKAARETLRALKQYRAAVLPAFFCLRTIEVNL
jgi:RNase H-fold protein (predicted Holliday junction resolvase)